MKKILLSYIKYYVFFHKFEYFRVYLKQENTMASVKIITDSNSSITQEESKKLNITTIPMPFTINDEEYFEDISITQDSFYKYLANDASVTTSQPSQFYLEEIFEETLKEYDELIYIPMSSGLSGTCANATKIASKFNGKVQVVDNQSISVIQKQSVMKAIDLVKSGKTALEIKQILEETKNKCSIYITVSTLKYLKKGGRVTPAAAAIGSLLKIKPILYSNGGNFEKFAMVLNFAQAKKKMIQQIKQDIETKLKDFNSDRLAIGIAHTQNELEALKFKEEIMNEIPNIKIKLIDPLSLSVSCHIGPGSLGVALFVD